MSEVRVIGAGFGRSGTTSLKAALEKLGYGPCYHMQTAMTRFWHCRFWIRARAGERVDLRRFFRHYNAAVDWPVCEFYREMMAAFPDARVVLSIRDPDRWYDSVRPTLWAIDQVLPWWFPPSVRKMHYDVIWNARFNGEFLDRDKAIAVYRAHIEEVKRTVPPGQLLVFDVAEGWQPLCDFLGVAVPRDEPFPRLNDRRFFDRVLLSLRVANWAVPVLVACSIGAIAYFAMT